MEVLIAFEERIFHNLLTNIFHLMNPEVQILFQLSCSPPVESTINFRMCWVRTRYEMVRTGYVLKCTWYELVCTSSNTVCTQYDLSTAMPYSVHTSLYWVPSQYILSTYWEHSSMYWVCTEYVLSTYSVHTSMYWVCTEYILSTGLCQLHIAVAVLLLGPLQSTNVVHTWCGTVLYWCVLCYSTIPPCTAL